MKYLMIIIKIWKKKWYHENQIGYGSHIKSSKISYCSQIFFNSLEMYSPPPSLRRILILFSSKLHFYILGNKQ